MSDDLVKRLRERAKIASEEGNMTAKCDANYFEKSADRIEELEAKLSKAVELGLEECPFWDGSGAYNDWWHDRRTTLKELTGARMVDDDGELVGVGDWIMFSYGIPPVRVYARLSTVKGVLTLTTQGKHKPRTMALAKLRDHVGCWYKSSGPIPACAELTGGKDE